MAFGFCLSVFLLLSVWSTAKCSGIPNGALRMECRDRYFMIAVNLSFTGADPLFEAVGGTSVRAITKPYAAQCGYTVRVLPLVGHVELRSSYFSCHTDNQDDKVFTFKFNLVATRKGKEERFALNQTCSPSLPWSPREVTCEENYMEVSVRSEIKCLPQTVDDWSDLDTVRGSSTSDWQVMFHRHEEHLLPMNLTAARKQGYAFDLTKGRLVFRTPYGQPDSFSTEVNGVPVEEVHATLFSRQSWIVFMVDLVAACSIDEGFYDEVGGYIMWETPEMPCRSNCERQLNVGLNGELVKQAVAVKGGFVVEKDNITVHISIPNNAEGGYRKSLLAGGLYQFYIFHLYLEQILAEDHVGTRVRFQRTLSTPLLPCYIFTTNRTSVAERAFTVYLGNIPEDVQLLAVRLNGQEFAVPFSNTSAYSLTKVVHPNNTCGFTLRVPFEDPLVVQKFVQVAVLQYGLDINFTLSVLPENELFYRLAIIEALFSPPTFVTTCSESGISFHLDRQRSDYLWEISVGADLLTPELAAQRGYNLSDDGQSLLLKVPLFSRGYEYRDIALQGFFGSFGIMARDHTTQIESTTTKTCLFSTAEFILCSTDGTMTVVADVSSALPTGGVPAETHLFDQYCEPKETDVTRALFSYPVNSCGSSIKLGKGNVTYQNEIFYSSKMYLSKSKVFSGDATGRVLAQCTYPVASLHRLFSVYKFESDVAGLGTIIHTTEPLAGLHGSTTRPIGPLQIGSSYPGSYMSALQPPARYKVSKFHNFASVLRKGAPRSMRTKMTPAQI
uniref:ZP domain-containing protein n=2 Tax=Gasterosteus aculeatus TaxID=69293 RepID=G3Q6S0_GASAC|nr:zona pellucida protein AX 4 [Gasterosteus aculeatus aculeatus]